MKKIKETLNKINEQYLIEQATYNNPEMMESIEKGIQDCLEGRVRSNPEIDAWVMEEDGEDV